MSQKINVNETPGPISPTLYFSQGDIGRVFTLEVVSSEGYTIPPGATVECVGTKPSGFGFSVPCTYTDNTVTLVSSDTEGQNFTDEAGRFRAELVITDGSDVIGTANFYMESERNPHPDGTIDGEAEQIIPELTLLVERVEKAASDILDMQVVATTLPAGSDATYSYDVDTNTATFGIPKGADGSLSSDVLASTYSSSATYAVGDYVYYSGALYRCTTAITTAESWTAAHWVAVKLAEETSGLKNALGNLDISEGYKTLKEGIIKKDGTVDITQTTYLHSDLIPVISADLYGEFRATGVSSGYYNVWAYNDDGDPISGVYANSSTTFNAKLQMVLPNGTKYIRFMISKSGYTNNPNFFFSQSLHAVDSILKDKIDAMESSNKIAQYTSVSMFSNIGVIGDSFSSGAIKDGDAVVNCYPISWQQILARKAGFTAYNYASTGADVSRFLYASHPSYSVWNIAKLESDDARDVYIVVLGINDEKSTSDHSTYVDVGTTADIDMSDYTQNADTFCGHYGEMLSRIIAHAPTSPIICVVPWNRKGTAKGDAIIAIAEMFGLPYFCMDDSDYYTTDFWKDSRELSHPIGVTYAGMANVFEKQIQACMIDNISYFANYRPQV